MCSSELTNSKAPINYGSDIVEEILKALPVKSLLRFRSVCKQWRSMIDDPYFVNSHRTRSYHRPGGVKFLVVYKHSPMQAWGVQLGYKLLDLAGEFPGDLQSQTLPRVLHSGSQGVEGLLCDDVSVWNPCTRKRLNIPSLCNYYNSEYYRGMGFDSGAREYKVVMVDSHEKSCRVLTLGTNEWRIIESSNLPEEVLDARLLSHGVYAQNKIFFKVGKDYNDTPIIGLLVFWVGEETFQFLPAPQGMDISQSWWSIIEFGNTIDFNEDWPETMSKDSSVSVWILCDVRTQKWDRVIYENIPEYWCQKFQGSYKIICSIHNTDEVLMQRRTSAVGALKSGGFCYWDIKKKKMREVAASDDLGHVYTKHVETLFDPTHVRMQSDLKH